LPGERKKNKEELEKEQERDKNNQSSSRKISRRGTRIITEVAEK
jgi:hypothetical protein